MVSKSIFSRRGLVALFALVTASLGQHDLPGSSIGRVFTHGDLIVIELREHALGRSHLFDLAGRTLTFTSSPGGYSVRNRSLQWDSDFGAHSPAGSVTLHRFTFPFAGQRWSSLLVGETGCVRFGANDQDATKLDSYGLPAAGVSFGRFDRLADAARILPESAPLICPFFKPRFTGRHYVKELADRLVVTWELTQPYGSLLDFNWYPTTNRFQAVLHRDGTIDFSYQEISAKDGIVGLFPSSRPDQYATEVRLSSLSGTRERIAAPYEVFHYLPSPRAKDIACTVIRALGDRFDFLALYSDFRIDSQEASTPSAGPLLDDIRGIGKLERYNAATFCTGGRLQLMYLQPVYVGSNEMQEQPPAGAPAKNSHDIAFYYRQEDLRGKLLPYNYAIAHLGHEVGHRWAAYVSANVAGRVVALGPWPHWAPELNTPVAFPYQLPLEASTIGGGLWQDNGDGTYTQLRDGYFVPAPGYSYLDLYLMGLMSASEVPNFFLLSDMSELHKGADGRRVFKANKTKIAIQDVIAANGARVPDIQHSQRDFNTGFVVIVEAGKQPSRELLERAEAIRRQWIVYWRTTTGHRSAMTTNPH